MQDGRAETKRGVGRCSPDFFGVLVFLSVWLVSFFLTFLSRNAQKRDKQIREKVGFVLGKMLRIGLGPNSPVLVPSTMY
jgi:hypothetical protein